MSCLNERLGHPDLDRVNDHNGRDGGAWAKWGGQSVYEDRCVRLWRAEVDDKVCFIEQTGARRRVWLGGTDCATLVAAMTLEPRRRAPPRHLYGQCRRTRWH